MTDPDARYLLGAMLADGVDGDLAARVADGYAEALNRLESRELLQWRIAVLARLDAGMHTALALHSQPSDHDAPHYLALANTHRKD